MARIAVIACIVIMCYLPAADAEIIEVPVPEFEGIYNSELDSKILHLDLDTSLAAVNGMWLELTATVTFGTGHGDGEWIPWDEWFYWEGSFAGAIYESGVWVAAFDAIEGQSTQTKQFEILFNADWDFLLDGTGDIYLEFNPMASLGIMEEPPSATVENATLIIDVTFNPVSAGQSTWGRIKMIPR